MDASTAAPRTQFTNHPPVDFAKAANRRAMAEAIETVRQRLGRHCPLVIGGQTSIMDQEDTTLRALREAQVEVALHGAPVEPGNMMAIGYQGDKWVLCAPGCAKSPRTNVVDLILPRLLAGERLDRRAVAALLAGRGQLRRGEQVGLALDSRRAPLRS